MAHSSFATRVASIMFGAARVALGGLWLHEGIFKYSAHFGRADILLIADSSNPRLPEYFVALAHMVLHPWAGVLGLAVPLIEIALGALLVLGILTAPAALASALTLMLYWSSDQLIAQYPVMGALSAVLLFAPAFAARYSVTSLVVQSPWLKRREPGT